MKYKNIFYISIVISILFWFLESYIHYMIFDHTDVLEIIPHDANELWMRSFICIMIILFGLYAHLMVQRVIKYENARIETLKITMSTVQDIVGNCFNQQQLMIYELDKQDPTNKEIYDKYADLIHKTSESINKMANMTSVKTTETSSGLKALDFEQP